MTSVIDLGNVRKKKQEDHTNSLGSGAVGMELMRACFLVLMGQDTSKTLNNFTDTASKLEPTFDLKQSRRFMMRKMDHTNEYFKLLGLRKTKGTIFSSVYDSFQDPNAKYKDYVFENELKNSDDKQIFTFRYAHMVDIDTRAHVSYANKMDIKDIAIECSDPVGNGHLISIVKCIEQLIIDGELYLNRMEFDNKNLTFKVQDIDGNSVHIWELELNEEFFKVEINQ